MQQCFDYCSVKMSFSRKQRVFIVEQYFASRSYSNVVDGFRVKYPGVAVPNNSTITILTRLTHFRKSGSVLNKKRTGRPTVLTTLNWLRLKIWCSVHLQKVWGYHQYTPRFHTLFSAIESVCLWTILKFQKRYRTIKKSWFD